MDRIKVLIVDDQFLMLDGLKTILGLQQDIEVVGMAMNGKEALQVIEETMPDVVLMDIRMPVMDGVECTKLIKEKYETIIVIILTTFDDDDYIIQALSYGASGYLMKDIDGDKLVRALYDAVNGNLLLPGKIAQKLASNISTAKYQQETLAQDILKEFTEREKEIIRYMVLGYTSKQIAQKLFLSQGTVKNYISNIYSKIGTNDRTTAVILLKDFLENSDSE